jgi:hypothetical protein
MKSLQVKSGVIAFAFSMCLCVSLKATGEGQKGAGPSAGATPPASPTASGNPGGSSASGGAGLPGVSYSRPWEQIGHLPPPETFGYKKDDFKSVWDFFSHDSFKKNVIIFCYDIKPNLSATQPFVLEPSKFHTDPKKEELCANSKLKAFQMYRFLIYRIDMSGIPQNTIDRIQTLNMNIAAQPSASLNSQRGSTINPTPTLPSITLLTPPAYDCQDQDGTDKEVLAKFTVAGKPLKAALCPSGSARAYYLLWPSELVGDTALTVSINLIYGPVAPGLPWNRETFYPSGSTVISSENGATNGHYYVALNGAISGPVPPPFDEGLVRIPEFQDSGGVYWKDLGEKPDAANFPAWTADSHYSRDDHVVPQTKNGHYYQAENGGVSGINEPGFLINGGMVYDVAGAGGVHWKDLGEKPDAARFPTWTADRQYRKDDHVVPQTANGHYYQAENDGMSGVNEPVFRTSGDIVYDAPGLGLTWENAGRTQQQTPQASPTGQGGAKAPTSGFPAWQPKTAYTSGTQVVPPGIGNGHYYEAMNAANSGEYSPNWTAGKICDAAGAKADGKCTGVLWQDMGLVTLPAWQAGTAYAKGAYVVPNPANGFYYEAKVAGVSGSNPPAFPVKDKQRVTESAGLIWMDVGSSSTLPGAIKTLKDWNPKAAFVLGDGIVDRKSGHYYVAIQSGISGEDEPPFSIPVPQVVASSAYDKEAAIEWQDLGTTPLASASIGTPPSDQTLNLQTLTSPQVHVLSRFNLSSGVIVSNLIPPSFSSVTVTKGCPNGAATCTAYVQSRGTRLIDPVLGVTVYAIRPLDAEQPFKWKDMTPAPTFDLSLSSPTSNFYFGFSSEFLMRNLQLVYGASIIQESRLGGTVTTINNQPTALFLTKKYNVGGYLGFSFNISGFLQSIIQ